ncbi:hypothetical protein [Paenibacillus chitinolyticus]|uniref:Uncharacterized protein n=1 Tax=Paenibacillus chitinolyticus TaxID=79263 RepID=A0ABT4FCY5_9BACL|nr:hypothetical protein [Paenibacillus chitinolyticus]MCY9588735.1 hypothetical protein [Paenibacillus chitinolyticus]MCY9595761.1 hypothetical protein [Paenibacillus chitinolyticus]
MDTLTDDVLNLIDQVDTDPIMQADESIYLPFTIQYVVICPIILLPEIPRSVQDRTGRIPACH